MHLFFIYQFTDVPVYGWIDFVDEKGCHLLLIYQFTDVLVYGWIDFVVKKGWHLF